MATVLKTSSSDTSLPGRSSLLDNVAPPPQEVCIGKDRSPSLAGRSENVASPPLEVCSAKERLPCDTALTGRSSMLDNVAPVLGSGKERPVGDEGGKKGDEDIRRQLEEIRGSLEKIVIVVGQLTEKY